MSLDVGIKRDPARLLETLLAKVRAARAMLMRWTVLFLFLSLTVVPIRAQVRVWEGVLNLPAYEEGAPDPNPPFDEFASGRFNYPYTMRKEVTDRRAEHQWRAIYLENEYLKCSVLPDLGGHIYTCIDKISGQPMFYANPSIKKARIGYRGAWAAFGVEFNFPVSHNWVSMSPVDFAYASHEDGSARITASFVTRRMDQFLCLFMEAARTSWVYGTLEQIQGPHILLTTPSYPRKRSGPGVSTQKVLVGVKHSPTTTAPM